MPRAAHTIRSAASRWRSFRQRVSFEPPRLGAAAHLFPGGVAPRGAPRRDTPMAFVQSSPQLPGSGRRLHEEVFARIDRFEDSRAWRIRSARTARSAECRMSHRRRAARAAQQLLIFACRSTIPPR